MQVEETVWQASDCFDTPTWFTLNVLLSLLLCVGLFGIEALIVFGLLGAAIGLCALSLIFLEAGDIVRFS